LHFRFETFIVNPKNSKRIIVFKDIVSNRGNLKDLENMPVPLGPKGQIRIKVLRMPCITW
jgi:hypothetical protein